MTLHIIKRQMNINRSNHDEISSSKESLYIEELQHMETRDEVFELN